MRPLSPAPTETTSALDCSGVGLLDFRGSGADLGEDLGDWRTEDPGWELEPASPAPLPGETVEGAKELPHPASVRAMPPISTAAPVTLEPHVQGIRMKVG